MPGGFNIAMMFYGVSDVVKYILANEERLLSRPCQNLEWVDWDSNDYHLRFIKLASTLNSRLAEHCAGIRVLEVKRHAVFPDKVMYSISLRPADLQDLVGA